MGLTLQEIVGFVENIGYGDAINRVSTLGKFHIGKIITGLIEIIPVMISIFPEEKTTRAVTEIPLPQPAPVLLGHVYFLIGASARFVRITSRAFFTMSFFVLMILKYSFLSHTL